MLMPSLLGENLLNDFFDFPAARPFSGFNSYNTVTNAMRTDVKETENGYELAMNLPGFKKEDVKAELKDGYLTVSASTDTSADETDDNGKYIRRERYHGSCSRSFYVGEQMTPEDLKAKFEDGVLRIDVPKKEAQPVVEKKQFISIEG